jgi:hypothetical protein
MICIGMLIITFNEGVISIYLMAASPFALFTAKVDNLLRKAFCINPKVHFDSASDISDPYPLSPGRKTFVYHRHTPKPIPMGSHFSDYSTESDNINYVDKTFNLLHGHGVIEERFETLNTSRILGQAEAYGKLTNQNPYGHWAPNDYPTSVYYDAPLAPTPDMTPNLIPKSLPNTPKLGASNLKPTTTDSAFLWCKWFLN